jgi:hypothetical protein
MNAAETNQNTQKTSFKLFNSLMNNKPEFNARIYINTLFPGFSYSNAQGGIITPKKCILQ